MPIPQHDELYTALSYVAIAGGSAAPAKAAKKADDDELDLFGDDDEEDAPKVDGKAARAAAAKAAKEAADAKKKKTKKIDKSLVTLVVKPWDAETDLDELFKLIVATEKEGLTWGVACEKEPVAYGIFQLKLVCTIVDELVLAEDITDLIEQFEDHVQSCQMLSMNKIS